MTIIRPTALVVVSLFVSSLSLRGEEIPRDAATRDLGSELSLVHSYDVTFSIFELKGSKEGLSREKILDYVRKAAAAWRASPDVAVQRSLKEGLGLDQETLRSSWSDQRIIQFGKSSKYIRRIGNANYDHFDDLVFTVEDGIATSRQKTGKGTQVVEISADEVPFYVPKFNSLIHQYPSVNINENLKGRENGLLELVYHPGDDPGAHARVLVDPKLKYLPLSFDIQSSETPPYYSYVRLDAVNLHTLSVGVEIPIATFYCRFHCAGDRFRDLTLTLITSAILNDPVIEKNVQQTIPKGSIVWLGDNPSSKSMRSPADLSPQQLVPILEANDQAQQIVKVPVGPLRGMRQGMVGLSLLGVLLFLAILTSIRFRRRRRGPPSTSPQKV